MCLWCVKGGGNVGGCVCVGRWGGGVVSVCGGERLAARYLYILIGGSMGGWATGFYCVCCIGGWTCRGIIHARGYAYNYVELIVNQSMVCMVKDAPDALLEEVAARAQLHRLILNRYGLVWYGGSEGKGFYRGKKLISVWQHGNKPHDDTQP